MKMSLLLIQVQSLIPSKFRLGEILVRNFTLLVSKGFLLSCIEIIFSIIEEYIPYMHLQEMLGT